MKFELGEISDIIIHYVGNRLNDDGCILSSQTIELDEILQSVLKEYFLNSFNGNELFHFFHSTDLSLNETYRYVKDIFTDNKSFVDKSKHLAQYLYECCNHNKIKAGEFYVVRFTDCLVNDQATDIIGLFKSENKDIFLNIYTEQNDLHIESLSGINTHKLDKGCLIFNIEKDEGYTLSVVDNTNKGTEAQYWFDNFLHVQQRKDEYYNTHHVMAMCKNYVTKHLPNEFMITKADQAEILNETIKYFKEQDNFSFDEFSQKVISDPKVVESFNRFKDEYEQERDIQIEDEFAISDSAVKKQSRAFKSVIKLDKNFHIYVHGNNQYIKKGYDETTGMYYYQLFFKEEL